MSKKCTRLWLETDFEVNTVSYLQNTSFSDHFWKFRCRKSAFRCGAKQISKPKTLKTPHVRTTYGGSNIYNILPGGRWKAFCTLSKAGKTWSSCSSFRCNHHYTAYYCMNCTTLHCIPHRLHSITLEYDENYDYKRRYYITSTTTFHYTRLITLHWFTLDCLHYSMLHCTALRHTTLQ